MVNVGFSCQKLGHPGVRGLSVLSVSSVWRPVAPWSLSLLGTQRLKDLPWQTGRQVKRGFLPGMSLVESWQRGCSAEVLDKGAGGAAALAPQTRPRL